MAPYAKILYQKFLKKNKLKSSSVQGSQSPTSTLSPETTMTQQVLLVRKNMLLMACCRRDFDAQKEYAADQILLLTTRGILVVNVILLQ